jgi:phosphate transport system protein
MRKAYDAQLEILHINLIKMGALCEDAIANAVNALLENNTELVSKTVSLEREIDLVENDIERLCVRLLLHQQPMASDLRHITAAQHMVTDMERIGDQARDIAEISKFMSGNTVESDIHIAEMAKSAAKMVTDSINAFVETNLELAIAVTKFDDVIDKLFLKIKAELADILRANASLAEECLDLLMVAKYLERIGDHAENIAEWVVYYLSGSRDADKIEVC